MPRWRNGRRARFRCVCREACTPILAGAGFVLVPSDEAEYCTASDVGETESAETALCETIAVMVTAIVTFSAVLKLLKCIFQQINVAVSISHTANAHVGKDDAAAF